VASGFHARADERDPFATEQPRGALKLGPVLVDLSAEVAYDYSDNELLEPVGQSGSHLGATATLDAVWRAAKVLQLKLTAELTRRQNLSGPTKSRSDLTITPGSARRYTAYVKDIRLTPFLNLSRQETDRTVGSLRAVHTPP
jgi:hypothetical protein